MSTENISSALPAGYMLRDYRIERAIGRGGFGITYLATEDITGRKVVIKENYPGGIALRDIRNYNVRAVDADNEEVFEWSLRSFVDEARVLTRLRHPHIVQVLTAFRELGTAYYVMDYIGGNSLSKMRPADITEQRLLDILRPILSALNYIHTLPDMLLHRDIKSDNILITPEGTPVLIDFGAARAVISNKTQTKIGTVGYAPPEQWASGAMRGPWTDLYALGATCYALITGQNPPDYHDRMFADPGSDLLAKSAKLQQTFSPELLASIDKAFALRPADRWQSAQDWLNALSTAQPTPATYIPKVEPSHHISKQAAIAELQRQGIPAEEYDSKMFEAADDGDIELMRLLIAAGANVNTEDEEGDIPLTAAYVFGHTECVKLLLATPGIDISSYSPHSLAILENDVDKLRELLATHATDVNEQEELTFATIGNRAECVQLLLDAGANVNHVDDEGWSPLMYAAANGHAECVQLLLDAGANANQADNEGWAPLLRAATTGYAECVQLLLDAGANVNHVNDEGWSPLMYAAVNGYAECVQLLLDAGANVNQADINGWPPLMYAAANGHAECVQLLLDAGANANAANLHHDTALIWAAVEGHIDCVKLLLNAPGINVTYLNSIGNSAIEVAKTEEIKQLLLEAAPIAKAAAQAELASRGIFFKKYDKELLTAAKEGNTELINLLIAAGANVNEMNGWWIFSDTPLIGAAMDGKAESIKCLLKAPGIDVNKVDKTGNTALYWAAYHGHTECVKILLSHPDIDVNKTGAGALRFAKNEEIKQLLREAGVKE